MIMTNIKRSKRLVCRICLLLTISVAILLINVNSFLFSSKNTGPLVRGKSRDNALVTATLLLPRLTESKTAQALSRPATLAENNNTVLATCSNNNTLLEGRFYPKLKEFDPRELAYMFPSLRSGGEYIPTDCSADQRVAIIIPYRKRWQHLHTLLPVLMPLLMRQSIHFRIFVIEQDVASEFNKGVLFNAGYLEALNVSSFDCFIFHDVDMIPVDDRNTYSCNHDNPVHYSHFVNKFKYKTMYKGLFGGVVGFTKAQFRRINGASNMYFGWGGEDDDLRDRVLQMNMTILRKRYGYYDMIQHGQEQSGWSQNENRFKVFAVRRKRQSVDGLNSVVYERREIKSLPLYTWIKISIDRERIVKTVPKEFVQSDSGDYNFEGS